MSLMCIHQFKWIDIEVASREMDKPEKPRFSKVQIAMPRIGMCHPRQRKPALDACVLAETVARGEGRLGEHMQLLFLRSRLKVLPKRPSNKTALTEHGITDKNKLLNTIADFTQNPKDEMWKHGQMRYGDFEDCTQATVRPARCSWKAFTSPITKVARESMAGEVRKKPTAYVKTRSWSSD